MRDHPWTWESRLWAGLFEVGTAAGVRQPSVRRAAPRPLGVPGRQHRRGRRHGEAATTTRPSAASMRRRCSMPTTSPSSMASRARPSLGRCSTCCGDPDRRPLRSEAARATHRLKMLKVANDAIRHHGLQMERELAVLAAIGKRGRPGTALVRELFAEMGCRYVPTESDLETVFFELCRTARLPLPEKQVSIDDAEGFIGRVDFLFAPNLIVEIDSSWHDGPLDELARRRPRRTLEAPRLRRPPVPMVRPRPHAGEGAPAAPRRPPTVRTGGDFGGHSPQSHRTFSSSLTSSQVRISRSVRVRPASFGRHVAGGPLEEQDDDEPPQVDAGDRAS